jgi:type III pantothenate kinase
MVLVVDIGNTNIALGVFEKNDLIQHWKIRSDREKTNDEYEIILLNLEL